MHHNPVTRHKLRCSYGSPRTTRIGVPILMVLVNIGDLYARSPQIDAPGILHIEASESLHFFDPLIPEVLEKGDWHPRTTS